MWEAIVGHTEQKKFLQSYLQAQERPHALLFSGPEGLGKRMLALAFAKSLLCFSHTGADNCEACHLMNLASGNLAHPDFLLVQRDVVEDSKGKIRYRDISIEQVRNLISQTAYAPAMGQTRVCVIEDAETMCNGQAEPANAFLKLLEEPPAGWVIIMLVTKADRLLPTILSRVVHLRFQPLPLEQTEQVLLQKGLPQKDAAVVARISECSLGKALRLYYGNKDLHKTNAMDYNIFAMRQQGREFLEALPLAVPLNYLAGRSWQSKNSKYQPEDALLLVQALQLLLYDLVLCKLQLYDKIYNIDFLTELKLKSGSWQLATLKQALTQTQAAYDALKRNVSVKTVLEAMMLKIDQIYKE